MAKQDAAPAPALPAVPAAAPAFVLVVVHPFGDYQRGDRIADPAEVDAVLASENAHHCNKVAA